MGNLLNREKNDVGKLCHRLPYIDEILRTVGEKKGERKQGTANYGIVIYAHVPRKTSRFLGHYTTTNLFTLR